MVNKDMALYREGRERSKITLTWLNGYKENFMKDLIEDTPAEGIVSKMLWNFNIGHPSDIASVVSTFTINWLDSPTGRQFIADAFEIPNPERKYIPNQIREDRRKEIEASIGLKLDLDKGIPLVSHIWSENYEQMIMEHVIYRRVNHETVSTEIWNAVNQGSPETPEIVADTIIGWLNTHVGRCFVRDAFQVDVPTHSMDGTD